jgi:hypothetical protein
MPGYEPSALERSSPIFRGYSRSSNGTPDSTPSPKTFLRSTSAPRQSMATIGRTLGSGSLLESAFQDTKLPDVPSLDTLAFPSIWKLEQERQWPLFGRSASRTQSLDDPQSYNQNYDADLDDFEYDSHAEGQETNARQVDDSNHDTTMGTQNQEKRPRKRRRRRRRSKSRAESTSRADFNPAAMLSQGGRALGDAMRNTELRRQILRYLREKRARSSSLQNE